jgi:hypothetical protein
MASTDKMSGRIALVLSVIAVALSVFAITTRPPPPEPTPNESYDRIVDEVWAMLQPVYADFDLALPEAEPETLSEALEPFLRISDALESKP